MTENKTAWFKMRMTPTLKAATEGRAGDAGMKVSAYITALIEDDIKQANLPDIGTPEVDDATT